MILIVDLSWKEGSLSEEEFVKPIERIVKAAGFETKTVHYTQLDLDNADKIILCGTALADNEFIKQDFDWLKDTDKPVFGICAGMQVIAKTFGAKIIESKEIGMTTISCNDQIFGKDALDVYQLHGFSATLPEGFEKIADNLNGIQAFKHDNIYGIQFHPEVRNEHILVNWLKL